MDSAYPRAQRQDIIDIIHGQAVPDPYRWLEDAGSAQTQDWLRGQDELFSR